MSYHIHEHCCRAFMPAKEGPTQYQAVVLVIWLVLCLFPQVMKLQSEMNCSEIGSIVCCFCFLDSFRSFCLILLIWGVQIHLIDLQNHTFESASQLFLTSKCFAQLFDLHEIIFFFLSNRREHHFSHSEHLYSFPHHLLWMLKRFAFSARTLLSRPQPPIPPPSAFA